MVSWGFVLYTNFRIKHDHISDFIQGNVSYHREQWLHFGDTEMHYALSPRTTSISLLASEDTCSVSSLRLVDY